MRILFLSAQIPGHTDWGGYLKTAAELTRRGYETLWASGPEVAHLVLHAGVPFHPLTVTGWRWPPPPPLRTRAGLDAAGLRQLKQRRALDQWLDVDRVAAATEELIALCSSFQPRLIVSEMFIAASGLVAEKLDVQFIVVGWPAPPLPKPSNAQSESSPIVAEARQRLDTLLDRFDLAGRNWTQTGPTALLSSLLHLTYWSVSWFGDAPTRPQTRHVGGAIPMTRSDNAGSSAAPDGKPTVLITLGTSFNRDPNFFARAADAASRQGCTPLVVFGEDLDADWVRQTIPYLPASTEVHKSIDFDAMLPEVTAAIHHGGAGTTHALVTHGIPQIVVPHAADQSFQARGVMRTGVGIQIAPRQATVRSLEQALSALLYDNSPYRQRARDLQAEFHQLGGVSAAADLIAQGAENSI